MMNRWLKAAFTLGALLGVALGALNPGSAGTVSMPQDKVMREFKGVKLGLSRKDARTAAGTPESSTDTSDDFKLTGDDTMTVHYDNDQVKAIQLAFLDPKNAPNWKDVVGDAEVSELANGAKTARKTMEAEKFWVSIYQSKDGTITRITISR